MTDILDFIPQRPPMVLVDSFLGFDGDISLTSLSVRKDNIFVDHGKMTECGVIEHMAQSAAARAGYASIQNNEPVSLGFIGSVNDFHLLALPQVGDTITTEIKIIQEVFNISLIEACSRSGGQVIAKCRMKIFLDK